MKKIISLFQRNYDGDRLVRNEIVPGAEWVIAGQGLATVKYDGTCCRVERGKLWKRYDAKFGRVPPEDFEPSQAPDSITGHWPGWIPVGDGPDDVWHREAWPISWPNAIHLEDGTYELCGPEINGNPEGLHIHKLIRHGDDVIYPPRTFDELKAWLAEHDFEGIVWHHPDGRMVKIKGKDFGLVRRVKRQ